jgi:hypothetical protein
MKLMGEIARYRRDRQSKGSARRIIDAVNALADFIDAVDQHGFLPVRLQPAGRVWPMPKPQKPGTAVFTFGRPADDVAEIKRLVRKDPNNRRADWTSRIQNGVERGWDSPFMTAVIEEIWERRADGDKRPIAAVVKNAADAVRQNIARANDETNDRKTMAAVLDVAPATGGTQKRALIDDPADFHPEDGKGDKREMFKGTRAYVCRGNATLDNIELGDARRRRARATAGRLTAFRPFDQTCHLAGERARATRTAPPGTHRTGALHMSSRIYRVNLRLNDAERARLDRVAAQRGLDRTDALRQLVKEASDRLPLTRCDSAH